MGRIAGESTITRLGDGRYYVLSGAAAEDRDLDLLTQGVEDGEDVKVTNITNDRGVLVVAGPNSRAVLSGLTDASLENDAFRWLTAQEIDIAGVPVIAVPFGYSRDPVDTLNPDVIIESFADLIKKDGRHASFLLFF